MVEKETNYFDSKKSNLPETYNQFCSDPNAPILDCPHQGSTECPNTCRLTKNKNTLDTLASS